MYWHLVSEVIASLNMFFHIHRYEVLNKLEEEETHHHHHEDNYQSIIEEEEEEMITLAEGDNIEEEITTTTTTDQQRTVTKHEIEIRDLIQQNSFQLEFQLEKWLEIPF